VSINVLQSPKSIKFLDANIFIRHLANDHPVQSPACLALVEAIEQERETVWTSDLVIAEVVFVLSSKHSYNVSRLAIRDMLLPLLGLPGIKLPNKGMYSRVFELYTASSIDFIDAYNAALMENRKQPEIYSYDMHFDRIAGITRHEP
jgi:predicted nucleic acid-binding protein